MLIILLAALMLYGCSSDEQRKQSHFTKGKQYFDKSEFKSAKIEFKNAVQIDPKFVQAIAHRDYTLTQALVLLVAGTFIAVNFLVDLAFAWIDPRIRYR
jgi:Tfp pilus assembly protein PilF